MLFNPADSIDFNGNTAPFIQYTYARIQSLQKKRKNDINVAWSQVSVNESETALIKLLLQFPEVINHASVSFSPAQLANYTYELVKKYNGFYHNNSILKAEDDNTVAFRLTLSRSVGEVIKKAMNCLGIQVPNRM